MRRSELKAGDTFQYGNLPGLGTFVVLSPRIDEHVMNGSRTSACVDESVKRLISYEDAKAQKEVTNQGWYAAIKPEPIDVMEGWTHLSLRCQLALKYLARVGLKGTPEDAIRDLEKCISYLKREINARRGTSAW